MPCSAAAFVACASERTCAAMRSSHQAICSIDVDPVQVGALQRQASDAGQLVAGVLEHLGQHRAQRLGALREHQAELGQQAADAVDQRGALFLEALAQSVHRQLALLLGGLDRHEAHVRPAGGLADRRGVVGVVLTAACRPCGTA